MELSFEDLYRTCDKCNGTGFFSETYGSTGGISMMYTRSSPCPECNGNGGTLTETGQAIAQLVKKLREREGLLWS